MKRKFIKIIVLLSIIPLLTVSSQTRDEFKLPDILGYKTLKCDFHTHTVFSDGNVWPTVRPDEAWREGLDAIAITDHLEYLPHKDDVNVRFNRSYEIAKPKGDNLNITVIRGSEITRKMPPGHFNAIFLNDADKLKTDDWRDAFKEARAQDAFIFWNHPGWKGHQKDGVPRWYDEHTELFNNGMMNGIEIVNEREYYPLAHKWAIEKNLTMMSNSDIHEPVGMDYKLHEGDYRSFTIVFAKNNSEEEIKDALINRRTAVYWNNHLIGDEQFLRPLFSNSISLDKTSLELKGKEWKYIQIKNDSDVDYMLTAQQKFDEINIPGKIKLEAGKIVLFSIGGTLEDADYSKDFVLPYVVENLFVEPEKGMAVEFKLSIKLSPKDSK